MNPNTQGNETARYGQVVQQPVPPLRYEGGLFRVCISILLSCVFLAAIAGLIWLVQSEYAKAIGWVVLAVASVVCCIFLFHVVDCVVGLFFEAPDGGKPVSEARGQMDKEP